MADPPYQPYYCEENVWRLLNGDYLRGGRGFAVFVSNAVGAVPVWNQRAADDPDRPVYWDYHAVAVEEGDRTYCVWDLDSTLGAPVEFWKWWEGSFPALDRVPQAYHPRFRVVSASEFVANFSSDRSHMRTAGGEWREPPPDWASIYEPERGMNLGRFVDMTADWVGEVYEADSFRRRFERASEA